MMLENDSWIFMKQQNFRRSHAFCESKRDKCLANL